LYTVIPNSMMDHICSQMNNLNVVEEIDNNTLLLKKDLETFMKELVTRETYEVDVYDLCVTCGHDLTWDHQYTIREQDIRWLKTSGLLYFFETMNVYIPINTETSYNKALAVYLKLLDLFSLTVEED